MNAGKAVLIAGPTASGKSALALGLAGEIGGTIINADSMQVYRDLRVITARPTPEEEASVPHRLYGHVDAAENYSVGRWLADVRPVLDEVRAARARADPGRRHRALFQGADAGAFHRAAGPGGHPGGRARADGGGRAGGIARRACRGAIPQRSSSPATARGSRARWKCWRRPGVRSPMASRRPAAIARSRARRESVSRARATRTAPPHRCALRLDACGRCARGSARAWRRASSIRCCRP